MPGLTLVIQKRRRLGVRHRLLRDLALLILVAAGAMLLLGFFTAASVKRDASSSLIRETSEFALLEYERATTPVNRFLLVARHWGERGMLAAGRGRDALLIPVLMEVPQIAGISIADTRGGSYYLARDREGWFTRTKLDDGKFEIVRMGPDQERIGTSMEEMDYDPRDRPWFDGALEHPGEIHDTDPYTFFSSRLPGITSSIAWSEKGESDQHWVISADFLLRDIGRVVADIRVGSKGRAFLIRKDGLVFQTPAAGSDQAHSSDFFVEPGQMGDGVVSGAVREWRKTGAPLTSDFRFTADGKKIWAGFKKLESSEQSVWLGVVVPEVDILGTALHRRRDFLLVGLIILVSAIALMAAVVRKYRHQLRDLPLQHLDVKSFEKDVSDLMREGESGSLEFKSTVRMNLATNKTGKEIEVAWLKSVAGFMNTDGGTLLIGVNDAGEPVGIKADGFANEDKCRLHLKNLVNEHIGAEFTRYLRFEIGRVDGHEIVAIECERCPLPVFLKAKGKESFYIRSGPSAVELSPSEVLGYVKQRS